MCSYFGGVWTCGEYGDDGRARPPGLLSSIRYPSHPPSHRHRPSITIFQPPDLPPPATTYTPTPIEPTSAVVTLKNRRRVQNHIGGIHACGMALAAESATGIVVGMNVPDTAIPLCKSMKINFVRRCEGAWVDWGVGRVVLESESGLVDC